MPYQLKNHFAEALSGDKELKNFTRQVFGSHYSLVNPKEVKAPTLIHYNKEVFDKIALFKEDEILDYFSGKVIFEKTTPYAMAYGGHQFGNWAGQLGDGRAINLFEVRSDETNELLTFQLKGAGATPYSRHADGNAVLRSSIREYLCAEAMYHLGIATTRSFSITFSGEEVLRDVLYNGNAAMERGAIVCRVAPSFIRFGSFQLFASRKEYGALRELLIYTISNFYSELEIDDFTGLFEKVAEKSLDMVMDWQRVGFVHGVMNTDNMSILGQTIDYGPYGWLEDFDLGWTPNTTDAQQKRYRFGNQPQIVLWNLVQLANAIYPLVNDAKPFEKALDTYNEQYLIRRLEMYKAKLGLIVSSDNDVVLIESLEEVLQLTEVDYTIFFRMLADLKKDDHVRLCLEYLKEAFYIPQNLSGDVLESWEMWLKAYLTRLNLEVHSDEERKKAMNLVNPKYVLRNYMAQLAIDQVNKGDYELLNELYELLRFPYDEQPSFQKWFAKRPDWARTKVGCSMLSCSS